MYHYETIATIIFLTVYYGQNKHWMMGESFNSLKEAQDYITRNQFAAWKIEDFDGQTILTSK